MDIYQSKHLQPMLVGASGTPFDSPEHIFELKLDGERCLAYFDGTGLELINKRSHHLSDKFPELAAIARQVTQRCVLDGELIVNIQGKPDFPEVARRAIMSNRFKIELAARKWPASYVAFDMLYLEQKNLMMKPLWERKAVLAATVRETERLAVSRYIEGAGEALFALAQQQELEGVMAKLKTSRYTPGKRTKDWCKIKNLLDDDFVICGYIEKEQYVVSLVLGQYGAAGQLIYKGHATLGVNGEIFAQVRRLPLRPDSPIDDIPPGNERAVWLEPVMACTVSYLTISANGGLRHPLFKGLRPDKPPRECRVGETT